MAITNKRKIVNDPVYGFLTIEDDVVFDVISHPAFQRQRRIKQLGFTYLVYPGATHTRFGHMLGALNLMRRALEVLRVKGVGITDTEMVAAQLAILLHDVGHGPFSHTSEFVIAEVHHEELTQLYMQRIKSDLHRVFWGRYDEVMDMAIQIFDDSYPKRFLHQLVSSQLDMDRLDYLSRDSFFTGVSEGVVGTERIINMLNVYDDELVIDEKGIYSVEKFIISRRLMYWQVYLHKTVVAADALLLNILRRARYLLSRGEELRGSVYLIDFLSHHYTRQSFDDRPELLDQFMMIDDSDIIATIKGWMLHQDRILSILADQLINRHLYAMRVSDTPFAIDTIDDYRQCVQERYGITPQDSEYFVGTGILRNHAYDFNDPEIKVLFKNGSCSDISEASDQLDRHFLEKQVTKYYIYFPKFCKEK
ncbi:MAG: HD domain-containing protein [Bacteroidales bacterium]|nr:HD domain-containing protein [Candidatus Colimorpha onthohippi]